jgi:hypothetical protein
MSGQSFRIDIDGKWSLENLYEFPRSFEQVYFAVESLAPAANRDADERIENAFRAFPWAGGYSVVNFYNQLKLATPPKRRPQVNSIRYASPGWIELALDPMLAARVATIVCTVAFSIDRCNKVYHNIYSNLQQRKLLRIEVETKQIELTENQISFLKNSANEMAKMMQIRDIDTLDSRTQNPLISVKILLSLYRRVRKLAEFQNRGKANFSNHIDRLDL